MSSSTSKRFCSKVGVGAGWVLVQLLCKVQVVMAVFPAKRFKSSEVDRWPTIAVDCRPNHELAARELELNPTGPTVLRSCVNYIEGIHSLSLSCVGLCSFRCRNLSRRAIRATTLLTRPDH